MKKILSCILAVVFVFTLAFVGIGCKQEAAEETTAAAEETTAAAEETTAAAEETTAAEVVAEESLTFVHINASDPADPFISKISKGWQEACAKLGVNSQEQFAYADVAKMLDFTNAAIAADVDGIFVFNSLDAEALHPSVESAIEKGIAFALVSSRDTVYGPDEVTFVGFDIKEQGYASGKWLAEQLIASNMTENVNIAIMAEFNAPYSQARSQGTLEALDEADITYNASEIYEVGIDLGVAVDKVKSYMLGHPETNVLLGCGSLSSPATVMVLQELGYEPGEIKWCGYDLGNEVVAGIQAGYGASNVDEVFNYGFYPAIALYLRAKYDFVVGDLPIATVMVDSTNIEGFLSWVDQGIK
ncbi:MAG: substrate-binding domain-containing protein [Actinobacteria bacterium]|nr:substrate-binding domain-containing protein [Actinomycetota bacterium]